MKNNEKVHGYKGLSKFLNISIGRARWLVENSCVGSPIETTRDAHGRITRIWNKKDLENMKEFANMTAPQLMRWALHYKQCTTEYRTLYRQLLEETGKKLPDDQVKKVTKLKQIKKEDKIQLPDGVQLEVLELHEDGSTLVKVLNFLGENYHQGEICRGHFSTISELSFWAYRPG